MTLQLVHNVDCTSLILEGNPTDGNRVQCVSTQQQKRLRLRVAGNRFVLSKWWQSYSGAAAVLSVVSKADGFMGWKGEIGKTRNIKMFSINNADGKTCFDALTMEFHDWKKRHVLNELLENFK